MAWFRARIIHCSSGRLEVASSDVSPYMSPVCYPGHRQARTLYSCLAKLAEARGGSARVLAGLPPFCLELRTQPLGLEAPTNRACGPARRGAVATGAGRRVQSFGEAPQR